ncbi:hypothetical protein [Paludibaculum fermentans]|uniref:Uncharacterized protein n=1 Tax=Paludibaculum fermentans TaxID=1473598 RepID=A0A7S7NUQ8_PALFE|nr:hypothetical protein [Paludibaculum fermentans]QOY90185.1 hypothetical protein IRI77_09590 [Paludibaculum fermentans]
MGGGGGFAVVLRWVCSLKNGSGFGGRGGWDEFDGQSVEGALDAAGVGLDPAGVAVEGLDEADLAEDPLGGDGFVAAAVLDAGVEEGTLAAFVEACVALEHVEFEGEGAALRVGDIAGGGFGDGSEVGFDASRHLVVGGVGSGAAGVAGGGGFAGEGAGAGGFAGVGAIGGKALFRDVGCWHGMVLSALRLGPGGLSVGIEALDEA